MMELKNFVSLAGEINAESSGKALGKLIELSEKNESIAVIAIISGGGNIVWSAAVCEMVRVLSQTTQMRIYTLGIGIVGSAAAVNIWMSVPKERRMLLPNSRLFLHCRQFSFDVKISERNEGTITEIEEPLGVIKTAREDNDNFINRFTVLTKLPNDEVRSKIEQGWLIKATEAYDLELAGVILW